jgi:hypothetical protein
MGIYLPAITRSLDSNVQTILSSAWARRLESMWYQRIVRRRTMDTGVDYIQWLLETARIREMGNGGVNNFGDMMGLNFSIQAREVGDNLKLTRMEILNALGATQNGVEKNALDYAASWSRQMGGGGAYWPQEQTAAIMVSGTGAALDTLAPVAYDGRPFFDTAHPINPVTKSTATVGAFTGGTYTNVFYGRPFTGPNYAAIGAYIEAIPAPDGKPRKIKPRIVATGTGDRLAAAQLFGAASLSFTDPLNPTGSAAASNIIKTLYDTEAPITDADLNCPGAYAGTWWIAAELREDDQLAGVIYDEREPFTLRGYADMSDPELARREEFEWSFKGWNKVATGHPFLLFQCVPLVPAGKTAWQPIF